MTRQRKATEQERFWRGKFGDDYAGRNATTPGELRARVALWARILDCMVGAPPQSILEVGANVGNNLRALRGLTGAKLMAVEPNAKARKRLVSDRVVSTMGIMSTAMELWAFAGTLTEPA